MTDGELMYLALCGISALAFVLALGYATTVASGGPQQGPSDSASG
jgi:hypothetical protein